MTESLREAPVRLAMLGMITGNEHPYSWSAIINGYDPDAMNALCPSAGVKRYLGEQPFEEVRIPSARVTHVWTDTPGEARDVAVSALIPNIVDDPTDVIGEVDAVMIATDNGDDHVRRARPFVEAGLPVFVDKPLATNLPDLRQFIDWNNSGALLQSCSGVRYSPEIDLLRDNPIRWIYGTTPKKWEHYGIHIVEPIFTLLGPGFEYACASRKDSASVIQLGHRTGTLATITASGDAPSEFGVFHSYSATGMQTVKVKDFYTAFRRQLLAFIDFVRTGIEPFPFCHTVELMATILAGLRSLENHGSKVMISDILADLDRPLQTYERTRTF